MCSPFFKEANTGLLIDKSFAILIDLPFLTLQKKTQFSLNPISGEPLKTQLYTIAFLTYPGFV